MVLTMLLGGAILIFASCEFAYAQTAAQAQDPEIRAAMACSGSAAAPMRQEASRLTLKDMIDVAAYAASRRP